MRINATKIFDLPCFDRCKSFYGKAKVYEIDNGEKVLFSYNTPVCKIDENGAFCRLWSGESATTTRHINSFLEFYNLAGGGLAWWRQQPANRELKYYYLP
ncbi:MAG: hypothetical protein J6S85_02660 [Methanobrevibacter sp.]|nr:hypothetical protein [Methanobrevibacter sp.]MBO7712441.1 hypothetical protein [Methanobrevibacter sp.]